MNFHDYIALQFKLHPCMQPQDLVKLCYQAAFGAEHLLNDITTARTYFNNEFSSVSENDNELYEEISSDICRVNLSAWKASGMPSEWLFQMFVNSASISKNDKDIFSQNLKTADSVLQNTKVSFTYNGWKEYLTQYQKSETHTVHHSEIYRQQEHPSYRIIHKRFLRLLPILQKAALLPEKKGAKIIAIDGRAASGKSTIAADLELVLGAGIIHVDDFFLPPELRSEERYAMPGGNVHYERFASEVLPFIENPDSFSYRIFDCHRMDYHGIRTVVSSEWRVVEGAYSCHPVLGDYADLKVFSDIDPKEQMNRLVARNGAEMAERFRTHWIPLEEKYYNYYKLKESADITLPLK